MKLFAVTLTTKLIIHDKKIKCKYFFQKNRKNIWMSFFSFYAILTVSADRSTALEQEIV